MNQMANPRSPPLRAPKPHVPKAWEIRNYRIYFLGCVVSVPGSWMQMTAQAWLVLKLTDSPLALAIVASLQFLPVMLFSLLGGAMADRFPRRNLMFITQSLGAAQALLLGVLTMTGTVSIWHVYVLAITLGMINALEAPLRQAFVGELVPTIYLPNAIAMQSMVQNLGRIVGPALGGVVIAAFGVAAAYFINCLTFLGVVVALLMIRREELQPMRLAKGQNIFRQVHEGLVYARRSPAILFLLIGTAFIGLFGQNFTTMVPLISNYLLHASAAEFGILNSCLGAGSFLAALAMTTRGAPSSTRILAAGAMFGLMLIAISFSTSLLVSSALFVVVGAAAVTYSASVNTSLQLLAPQEMRGRLVSMTNLLIPSPIGPMLTGAAASSMGVGVAVLLNGFMCCAGILLAYAYFRSKGGRLRSGPRSIRESFEPEGPEPLT
jgi:MFS family permease